MARSRPLIAISDSELALSTQLVGMLKGKGYSVMLVPDKCRLFNLLSAIKPDLIITSIRSDNLDGMEFLESVKSSYRLREIPVIVVSSHAEMRPEAERLGADEFLEKPVSIDELEQSVKYRLMGSPWPATEA